MVLFNTRVPRAARPQSDQKGFSLIELMIVVAIISILAMIALPQYQRFATRAKVAAALSELIPGKAGLEILLIEEYPNRPLKPEDVGLPEQGSQCASFLVTSYELFCMMKPDAVLGNSHLNLRRDSMTGAWSCHADVPVEPFLPKECRS